MVDKVDIDDVVAILAMKRRTSIHGQRRRHLHAKY